MAVRRRSLSVWGRGACSEPRKEAAYGEADWDEGKDPPDVTCGATRPIFTSVFFRGGGIGGCWWRDSVWKFLPFSFSSWQELGNAEITKIFSLQAHTQNSVQHISCLRWGGFMPVIGSVHNSLCINEVRHLLVWTESNHFHDFTHQKCSYRITYCLTLLKQIFYLNSL